MINNLSLGTRECKIAIDNNVISYIRSVEVVLSLLDAEHFQLENGVEPHVFDGCATIVGPDTISINPVVTEPDDELQKFRMRSGCFITGRMLFIRPNGKSCLFNIVPLKYKDSSEFTLVAKSNCDIDNTNAVEIKITLDEKKRIKMLIMSDIKLSDFPNARREFMSHINSHLMMVHANKVMEMSHNLAFEFAKAKCIQSVNNVAVAKPTENGDKKKITVKC
jgi:hypothetical protein